MSKQCWNARAKNKVQLFQHKPAQHTHQPHAPSSSRRYMTKALDSKITLEQQSASVARNWRAIVILLSGRASALVPTMFCIMAQRPLISSAFELQPWQTRFDARTVNYFENTHTHTLDITRHATSYHPQTNASIVLSTYRRGMTPTLRRTRHPLCHYRIRVQL